MDQSRMIMSILAEANLNGAADEHILYAHSDESLSKPKNSSDLDRHLYNKYLHRKIRYIRYSAQNDYKYAIPL